MQCELQTWSTVTGESRTEAAPVWRTGWLCGDVVTALVVEVFDLDGGVVVEC